MKKKDILNIKESIKGIAIICLYPLALSIIAIPFYLLLSLKIINEQIVIILTYLFASIILFIYFYNDLKKDFISFKKNYKTYMKKTLFIWIIGVIIMIVTSNIISLFKLPVNTNQQTNIDQLVSMPLAEIICACILAPFIEELVYRKSMTNFTPNKHLYAIITGLIFAFVHVSSSITNTNSLIMLLYLIPYGALGISLGYAYKETNNIISNMIIHMLHNTISIIELLIILHLGGTL